MAIEVRHGVGPAPVAAAAFGGGQGSARSVAARGRAAALGQEEAQKRALAARERQIQQDRQFRADESAIGHERGLERLYVNAQLQDQLASGASQRRQSELEHSLTTKQRLELSRLAEAEAQALASTDYTDDEKSELRRRFAARRAGIKPVERPREPTPAEKFEQSTYTAKDGTVYPLNPDGTFGKPLYQPPERQPTVQDRVKAFQAVAPMFQDENGVIPASKRAELEAYVNMLLNGSQGGQAGPGPGQPPLGPGVRPMPKFAQDLAARQANRGPYMDPKFVGETFTRDLDDVISEAFAARGGINAPGPTDAPAADPITPVYNEQRIDTDPRGMGGQSTLSQPEAPFRPVTDGPLDLEQLPDAGHPRARLLAVRERQLKRQSEEASEAIEAAERELHRLDYASREQARALGGRPGGQAMHQMTADRKKWENRLIELRARRKQADERARGFAVERAMYEAGRKGR